MKRVFVTGATSMLGCALIEQCLKQNTEVYALVRPESRFIANLPQNIHIIWGNLLQIDEIRAEQLPQMDVFYHFAWDGSDKGRRMDVKLQNENLNFSLSAMELAKRLNSQKFIGAGSQAEYGVHKTPVTSPESPVEPVTAYGITKYAAGKLCELQAETMDYAWIRIFSVYGIFEHSDTMISSMIPRLLRNEYCPLTLGTQNWDFLYSEDAGSAFYAIGEKLQGHKTYCLGSGIYRTIHDFLTEMKSVLKSDSVLGFGDIPYDSCGPISICADISALRNEIGWKPTIDFGEGILRKTAWMRKAGLL